MDKNIDYFGLTLPKMTSFVPSAHLGVWYSAGIGHDPVSAVVSGYRVAHRFLEELRQVLCAMQLSLATAQMNVNVVEGVTWEAREG